MGEDPALAATVNEGGLDDRLEFLASFFRNLDDFILYREQIAATSVEQI